MTQLSIKIVIILLIIGLLQLSTGRYLLILDDNDHIAIKFISNKTNVYDIVFFGDSVLNAFDKDDTNKKTIPVLLSEQINNNIYTIQHGAYHVGIYLKYIEYLVDNNIHPSLIIIPINLRSFSQEWDTNPSYQFEKQSFILKYGKPGLSFLKPVSVFTDQFKNSSEEQWQRMPVYDFEYLAGKVSDFQGSGYEIIDNDKIKKKIIFHYRYKLTTKHRKMVEMETLIDICNKNKLRVLFYITPVDVNFCDSVYPGTKKIIEHNVSTIVSSIKNKNCNVIDLSEAMPSDYFSWKDDKYPNEHLNEKGRKYVAETLALAISPGGDQTAAEAK